MAIPLAWRRCVSGSSRCGRSERVRHPGGQALRGLAGERPPARAILAAEMDAASRARLVELRHLLRQAQDRAGDRSTVGRHTALILLDGACELAMGLASAERGLKRPATFHATFKSLQDHLRQVGSAPASRPKR
jgi:hypothetical protein